MKALGRIAFGCAPALTVLPGCAGGPSASGKKLDADVIVVGSGLAGTGAAYSAVSQGAKVLLIEKNGMLGGTSLISSGTFCAALSKEQEAKGIKDSYQLNIDDVNRIGHNKADQNILKKYVVEAAGVWQWFLDKGMKPNAKAPYIDPVHSAYSVARTMGPEKGMAAEYTKVMMGQIDANYKDNLTALVNTKVTGLVKEGGKVVGVTTTGPNGDRTYRAKAVVLASGGYSSNTAMIAKYTPQYAHYLHITGAWATGECLEYAEAAGAQLVNMDYIDGYFAGIPKADNNYEVGFGDLTSGFADRWLGDIWVDSNGRRFVNEDDGDEDPREVAMQGVKDGKMLIVFDQGILEANNSKTPLRNFDKLLETGYAVKKADSPEELAKAFNVDPAGLAATIKAVNDGAAAGKTDEFGKTTAKTFGKGPYYGILCYPTIFMTYGGIRVDTELRALDSKGVALPGLYVAGESMGVTQWAGHGMPGGMGVGPAIVFGLDAGREAAAYAKAN